MSDPTASDRAVLDSAAVPAPLAEKPAARWEDFVDIFYAPSQVFARREHSGFGIPMLVVTVVSAVIMLAAFNAMSPIMDAEFARNSAAMIKKGATAEQLEKGRAIAGTIGRIAAVIAPPVLMFIVGLLLWVFGKFVGAKQTLNAAIMVAAFSYVPRLVGGAVAAVQALLMDPAKLNSRHAIALSAARFMDVDTASPVALALAGRLDLFIIWSTILLAIGLAVTGRIPRSRAAIAALLLWVCGSLPELMGAMRQ